MAVTIGTNITALKATRRLNDALTSISQSYERLSSGMRINRASDDPAGVSVAVQLNAKSRQLNRAQLNISDGTSTLQIADSAFEDIGGLLARMGELAAQAANGTFSSTQRRNLDKEFGQLDLEIRRIGGAAAFNGLGLFSGQINQGNNRQQIYFNGGSPPNAQGISVDGTYAAFYAADTGHYKITNTQTGESRDLGSAYDSVNKVLSNGDAVLSYDDGSGNQLYYFNFATGGITQLTNSQNGSGPTNVVVSEDGSTIAFTDQTNYQNGTTVATANGTGSNRLYVLSIATGIIRTTGATTTATSISISSDGSRVAYLDSGTITSINTSGTNLNVNSTFASGAGVLAGLTNDGRIFLSSVINLTGQNSQLKRQIFEINTNTAIATARQITNFTGNGFTTLSPMRMSVDGTSLYFADNKDVTGQNSGLFRQVFKIDLTTGSASQLTNLHSNTDALFNTNLFISADGGKVLYQDFMNGYITVLDTAPESSSFDFEVGQGTRGGIIASLQAFNATVRGLGAYSLTSQQFARSALDAVTKNIQSVDLLRSTIGASMSRLQTAMNVTQAQQDQSRAAFARITDVDVAQESSELVRKQIIQQTGAAVLAQANQLPSLVLTLLGR